MSVIANHLFRSDGCYSGPRLPRMIGKAVFGFCMGLFCRAGGDCFLAAGSRPGSALEIVVCGPRTRGSLFIKMACRM